MEISTPKATRRCTRLRVELPVIVTSLDRRHTFSAECMVLVVAPQGCGFRASQALPLETPVLLSALPGGGKATGRIANCLPLGRDGAFLIGVSLYNHGNVWGIANPPEDWNCGPGNVIAAADKASGTTANARTEWPYSLFSGQGEFHPGRK